MRNSVATARKGRLASSTALAALIAAGMVATVGQAQAQVDGIVDTTPVEISVGDIVASFPTFDIVFENRPKSVAESQNIVTTSDIHGVDVQVRTSVGLQITSSIFIPLITVDGVGHIDIDVQDVTALVGNRKGINASNAAGNINISAGDILSNNTGVDARIKGAGFDAGKYFIGIPGIGNIDIDVGDVTSNNAGGINAETSIGTIRIEAGDVTSAGTGVHATSGVALDLASFNLDAILGGASNGISISVDSVDAGGDGIHAEFESLNLIPGFGGISIVVEGEDGPGDVNANGNGIHAVTGVGGISIAAGDVTADNGFGVNAQTMMGASLLSLVEDGGFNPLGLLTGGISIDLGDVDSNLDGINAEIGGLSVDGFNLPGVGGIDISAGIVTSGNGDGIIARTGLGIVHVDVDDVTATNGSGISAITGSGAAIVHAGDVESSGTGIEALVAGGTFGGLFDALGLGGNPVIDALNDGIGVAFVSAGNVTSTDAGGIVASVGMGGAGVFAGNVESQGTGINVTAGSGLAFAVADNVTTGNALEPDLKGATPNAHGINVEAGGIAFGHSTGLVETHGNGSYGVRVIATEMDGPLGDLVNSLADAAGNVIADFTGVPESAQWITDFAADALDTVSDGIAIAVVDDVTTSGDGSGGVLAEAQSGVAGVLAMGHVQTAGSGAAGIEVLGDNLAVVLANEVSTSGTNSAGILALATDGSAIVIAGTVETSGVGSAGIINRASGSSVTIFSEIHTTENDSPGVDAFDDISDVWVAGIGLTTQGDRSAGILAESISGDIGVLIGSLETAGADSEGIHAENGSGDINILAGRVNTEGANSVAIHAKTDIIGSVSGDIDILAGSVATAGADSGGIYATSYDGDIRIVAGQVSTKGARSAGVEVYTTAEAFVIAGSVSTEGDDSDGVEVQGDLGATVIAGPVSTIGAGSYGLDVSSVVETTVVALGDVDASGADSIGIHAISQGDTQVTVLGDVNGGSGSGGAGVSFSGVQGSGTLINLGSIASANDRAILNMFGDSTTINLGSVTGYVQMFDGEDTFINAGTFAARGDSDFGEDEDAFINAGLMTLAERDAVASVTIAGLETFDNSVGGTVSLLDDRAGDALILSDSDFVAGGFLAIDAQLRAGGAADMLTIGGDVLHALEDEGSSTALIVNDLDGGPGEYNPEGVLFARVSGDTDIDDFSLNGGEGIDKGLFRYNAYLRAEPVNPEGDAEWVLASTGDAEAYEFPSFIYGAQNLWHASAGVWLDRMADLRGGRNAENASSGADYVDAAGGQRSTGVWGRVFGGTLERDTNFDLSTPAGLIGPNLSWSDRINQRWLGLVAGVDFGEAGSDADGHDTGWIAGLMGGYTSSDLDFDLSATKVDYRQGSIGAYASWYHGGLYLDAALKGDFGRMNYKFSDGTGMDEARTNYRSLGAVMEAGYRMDGAHGVYVEPKATLAYVHTSFDDFEVLGTGVSMDDASSLRGRLGLRLGARLDNPTVRFEPWLEASVWNEFRGDHGAVLIGNSFNLPVGHDFGGTIGEVSAGANLMGLANGWTAYARGSVQFGGDDYRAYAGNVGLRKSW